MVCVLLEGCVSENRDSQEQRGDSATEIGYNGQDLLIIRVHRSPGDILETKAHKSVSLQLVTVIVPTRTVYFIKTLLRGVFVQILKNLHKSTS